jgi:hypothetical protein
MWRLPTLNVEGLQSLTVCDVGAGVSVLRRATRLTHLDLRCCPWGDPAGYQDELVLAVARMSMLRSLDLTFCQLHGKLSDALLSPILQALPNLTRLSYRGRCLLGRDMEACTSLPCLRSLKLRISEGITAACVEALHAMSRLTSLTLEFTRVQEYDLTPEVRAEFDVERHRQGWPALRIKGLFDD